MLSKNQVAAAESFIKNYMTKGTRANKCVRVACALRPLWPAEDKGVLALQIYYVWVNAHRGISSTLAVMAAQEMPHYSWDQLINRYYDELEHHIISMKLQTLAKWDNRSTH